MGAFILAGLIAVVTIFAWLFVMFAAGMSSAPSASADISSQATWILVIGLGTAAMIVASHWLPHIDW